MQDFKDFTVNEKNFPDFPEFVKEMKDQELRLIPIIDAGVKVEKRLRGLRGRCKKLTTSVKEKTEVDFVASCLRYGRVRSLAEDNNKVDVEV